MNGIENTNNKEYWENYVDYWVDKVSQTNNHNAKDKTLDDHVLNFYLQKLNLSEEDEFLDFGCGFCRIYPYYVRLTEGGRNYNGIDIAEAPLRLAEKNYPELQIGKQLLSFDGDTMPFVSDTFDKVVCFGVFDACNQGKTLVQLIDKLKVGGKLLITGKNHNYFQDDEEAVVAERNARKKGHPNYFTNVTKMKDYMESIGCKIAEQYYFLRRGDFPNNQYLNEMPSQFYEWVLIIEKYCSTEKIEGYPVLSDSISETFKRLEHQNGW